MLRSARNSDMEYNETSLTLLQKMVKVWILNTTHILDRERKAKKIKEYTNLPNSQIHKCKVSYKIAGI